LTALQQQLRLLEQRIREIPADAPLVVAEIWRVIAQIRETGISTLIVDRDYKKVLAHTDKAVVMEKGRLALQAESADLLQQPEKLSVLLGV
jgi:branched-chain amino acid transport system ATP-binding protein